jgi:hypothetical protein
MGKNLRGGYGLIYSLCFSVFFTHFFVSQMDEGLVSQLESGVISFVSLCLNRHIETFANLTLMVTLRTLFFHLAPSGLTNINLKFQYVGVCLTAFGFDWMVPYVPRRLPFVDIPVTLIREMAVAFTESSEPELHVVKRLDDACQCIWGALTRERQLEFVRQKLQIDPACRPLYPEALSVAVLTCYGE